MMSVEVTSLSVEQSQESQIIQGEVPCALTGKLIKAEEAYWAPPLITAKELINAIITNAIQTPSNLGHVLFAEQPNVPYAPEAREMLGSRRTVEQLKLLGLLLVIAAIIATPIILLTMR